MKIKFKKTHPEAQVPTKAVEDSAGYDLTAVSERIDLENRYLELDTGVAVAIPKGFVGLLFARSSLSNKDLVLSNGVGVIDPGYSGSLKFRFKNLIPNAARKYSLGDRIGQLLVVHTPELEFEEVKELEPSKRGTGGFGSSDL